MLSILIVSHNNGKEISKLLLQLEIYKNYFSEILILSNIPENIIFPNNLKKYIKHFFNKKIKGYGENINYLSKEISENNDWFLVLNPDVDITYNDLTPFFKNFREDYKGFSIIGLKTFDSNFSNHSSYRKDFFNFSFSKSDMKQIHVKNCLIVDWIPGYFMLIQKNDFNKIDGFDSKNFFMYLEDADLCRRMRKLKNDSIIIDLRHEIRHDSQRNSRKKIKYFIFHLSSFFRYFIKYGIKIS